MQIKVTQDDIDKGEKENGQNCPVARALRRETGDAWEVDYGSAWKAEHGGACIGLPERISRFVHDFDAGRECSPVEFDLPIEGIE